MQTSKLFNTLVAAALLSGASITATHAADSAPKAPAAPAADTVVAANAAAAVPDETITSSAKAALSADAQAAALPVNVATKQGVVVLSGDVPSAEAGDRVVQIVASVSGVKEIKNELKVKAAG
ncbi:MULTISPECIES: BON domain-containing protein [unclassified Janthinobacterium]|uniref:BON domain-containing protein n=1 Tax=unclassified Janthinobacterium TaxID=2610881 RepID=UPI0016165F9A|nr:MULTISPECIES: BON domain-containing protein [unclassified Janthinobacterium]MBB5609617.1 hyperosmotically inducible protein [Janthinobacterium sp. S3T4]MBB5614789.1 hyperosmotically inducible protein [Janthinobacterium sp. S3M3]